MVMNAEEMLDRNITMDDVHFAINNMYSEVVSCTFSDYNSDNLVFRLRLKADHLVQPQLFAHQICPLFSWF